MTAQSLAHRARHRSGICRSGLFLGFGTFFRKELTDWVRGRRALVIGAVVDRAAVFTTLIPFVAQRPVSRAAGRCRWTRPPTSCSAGPARPSQSSRSWPPWPVVRRARPRHAGLEPDQPGLPDQRHRGQVAGGGPRARRGHHPRPARRLGRGGNRRIREPSGSRYGGALRSRVHRSSRVLCRPDTRARHGRQGHRRDRRHRLRRHVPSVRDRRPRAGDRRAQPDRDRVPGRERSRPGSLPRR